MDGSLAQPLVDLALGDTLHFLSNVSEHAPPPLNGEGAEAEELHGGCCVSACSPSYLRMEAVNRENREAVTWVEARVETKSSDVFTVLKAAEVLMRDLFIKEESSRPNNSGCLLRVEWLDAPQRLAPNLSIDSKDTSEQPD